MFEQKINPEKFFLRDICYLRDTAKAFLHETSASNNKAFDGHSAIQLLANDRFMDRSLGGRSANFAQDPLTCHRPAMSAHLRSCPMAWCRIGYLIALSGWVGRVYQAATAGSLMMGSWHKPAMVSSVI